MSKQRYSIISTTSNRLAFVGLAFVVSAALTTNPSEAQAQARRKATASRSAQKSQKAAKAAKAAASRAGDSRSLGVTKQSLALPQSQALKTPVVSRSLGVVKPPRTNEFYEKSQEAEYERLVDQEINALYKLSQSNRRSPNRGEIWLRLGERYVEKARLVQFREQAEYDKKLKEFNEKKTKIRPRNESRRAREYNEKAVQLYEWFVKDFPKDPKVDQALFFLGYNMFELDNPKAGEEYYLQLLRQFPESAYVTESRFALGEYYFENENWAKALENYNKVIAVKRARLNAFALYKSSWCYYRLGRIQSGLQALERVVRLSRASENSDNIAGRRAVNKVRLATEALKDYVPFYSEVGDPKAAAGEFERLSGDQRIALQMLERLAYIYADSGNRPAARLTFKQLISMNPSGEKAAEYQYQIVLAFATSEPKESRRELDIWLESFGPESFWAKENAKNQKLVTDVARLQETTLRNNVLQLHQTAQNARTEFSQKQAAASYSQYFKYFPNSQQNAEMRFFYAELLFDMGRYEDSARLYQWVADREGPYKERATMNTLLALEKDLPSVEQIEAKRGKSLEKMPLDPPVERFAAAVKRSLQNNPKGEKASDIRRRLGVLYYSYNHFEEAIDIFEQILKDDPKSPNAEIAGNLILDIFKLKGDIIGLADKAQQMLQSPQVANSKFGAQLRTIIEKATYARAEKLAESGDSGRAAKDFETFAASSKQQDIAAAARYKAATNFEKSNDLNSAIRMHMMILSADTSDSKVRAIQNDSRNSLARIYSQTGQLELAAKSYREFAAANPKDSKAINGYFNAGVIYDGLGMLGEATQSYQAYYDRSKNADRIETLFLQAEMHRKRGNNSRALALYDRYLKEGPRSQSRAVQAAYEIAQASKKLGRPTPMKQWFQKTIAIHKASGPQARQASVAYAAEARFELAQETLRELLSIRFTANDKQQAKAAMQVKALRERYIGEMKEVIRYDNGPWIVAALASSGKMFDSVAHLFSKIPAPAGFSPEDAKKYKDLIQVQINGLNNEAKSSYKAAIEKSQELEAYSEWTKTAQAGLGGTGAGDEIAADARAADWMGL